MKKKNLKSLKLNKKSISNLDKKNEIVGGGGIGEPSFHCGTLGCESIDCPSNVWPICQTEEWTNGECASILP